MNLLTSSVVKAEESEDFAEIQLSHIRAFRAHHPDGDRARVSQGLVVIPTDTASPEQRAKYEEYAEKRLAAHRHAAGAGPHDVRARPRRHLRRDRRTALRARRFREIDEVAFALPFTFDHDDYVQILTDIATRLGPALGWQPSSDPGRACSDDLGGRHARDHVQAWRPRSPSGSAGPPTRHRARPGRGLRRGRPWCRCSPPMCPCGRTAAGVPGRGTVSARTDCPPSSSRRPSPPRAGAASRGAR